MNPNRIITTFDKTPAVRKNCKYIQGQFYIKDRQCFYIENQWNRINNGKIIFDYETTQWIKKSSALLREGIVEINKEGGEKIIYGYYTPNPLKNIIVGANNFNGVPNGTDCISEEVATKLGLVEAIIDGRFYQNSELSAQDVEVLKTKIVPQRNSTYRFPFEYSSGRMIPEFIPTFQKHFSPITKLINTHRLKFLSKYTWGVEFETSKGTIPERFLWPNGLIACRDGSISGFEYVTIPLQGKKGIQAIYNSCALLQKYTAINANNALHIHVGNYPISMKSIIAIYRLGTRIQNEIYSMFPAYYHDTAIFKHKSYCGPLKNISSSLSDYKNVFYKLYEQISGGYPFEAFDGREHPMDRSGNHKWNINPRYKYLNIIPLIFGNKRTVEFRVHTPTANPNKVIYWLFILIAILEFARKHQNELIANRISIDTSLDYMITEHYSGDRTLASNLIEYIKLRKTWFAQEADPDGKREISADSTFNIDKII
jgi:hypothetical protein